MARHARLFLNKVIEDGDIRAINRNNIHIDDMPTPIDKATYQFITQYADENDGKAPSYALVASKVDGFTYIPQVTDSYTYLAKRIKSLSATNKIYELFESGEMERKLNSLDGHELVGEWLPNVIDRIKATTEIKTKVGRDVKSGVDDFLEEYDKRKLGESYQVWTSRYNAVDSYVSGNMYTYFGESGRGKSVIVMAEAINLAMQGATVLFWSLEMAWYEVMVRAYTMLSADKSVCKAFFNGMNLDAGFDSNAMRHGTLTETDEDAFRTFLSNMNEELKGNLIIRSVDDEGFRDRTLKALMNDVDETVADVVIIDPFYYLSYEKNTSRTTGGDASETSKALRALTGRKEIVTIAITQSDVDDSQTVEGTRQLQLPKRSDVKKTKALLEDAAMLIGVDTDYKQGIGRVGIAKGRDGGEGDISHLIYAPQYGIIKEVEVREDDFDDLPDTSQF